MNNMSPQSRLEFSGLRSQIEKLTERIEALEAEARERKAKEVQKETG
jgi:hypothetical protein